MAGLRAFFEIIGILRVYRCLRSAGGGDLEQRFRIAQAGAFIED